MGSVERSQMSKVAPPTTIYDLPGDPEIIMIIADDEKKIDVLERPQIGEMRFYSFEKMDIDLQP